MVSTWIEAGIELAKALGLWPLDKILPFLISGFLLFTLLAGKLEKVKERIEDIEKAIVEIQTLMRSKRMPIQACDSTVWKG